MRMQFILALCLLYSLSVNLPIAFSLRCYECVDFPGSNRPCINPSVRYCNHQQDSCQTLVVTGEINQYRYTSTVKNCSSYQYGCNSRNVCNLINESIAENNGILLACSVNCCYGDLCNGQVNLTTRPWTNPWTTYQPAPTSQNPSACRQVVNDVLESPGYPSNYPEGMDCVNMVNITRGASLNITFYDFNLEDNSNCRYDYLTIENDSGHTYGKYCGDRSGLSVVVTGRYAVITFHSDGSVQERGFRLLIFPVYRATTFPPWTNPPTTYQPVATTQNPSGCRKVVNDVLESPGYPSNYPDDMDCVTMVNISRGAALNITFYYFNLEFQADCSYDYLKIETDVGRIGKYCGDRTGLRLVVPGRVAIITFHSDGSVSRRGFRLFLQSVPQYNSTSPSTVYPSQRPTRYPTGRPTRYPTRYPISRTTRYPTGYPTAGPGPDPRSQLKYCISLLRDLLVQMEFIVDYELGGNSNLAKRDHIVHINKAIKNVDIAMKRTGGKKRDVTKTMEFVHLKKKAADLIRKLQDKNGQYKRKSLLKLGKKKRELKSRELMRQTAESIKNLFNMEMKEP